ncbi:uncharacterized protein LOC113146454 [Cyclospora cayetanensis]|uniref:Uncharacterized protein LOC113146454 n=1 Tax=Cyclospora cayetanensis TaxID=88456 RepID=A0A6P6RQ62_9EIME|nr:uncharacterized protein LOC113146454 [Cyclospora cayetanensis]
MASPLQEGHRCTGWRLTWARRRLSSRPHPSRPRGFQGGQAKWNSSNDAAASEGSSLFSCQTSSDNGFRTGCEGSKGCCQPKALCQGFIDKVFFPEFWVVAWKNLKASWVHRLVRSVKISAMMVLAIHMNLQLAAENYLGTNFLLLTYCLNATLLPEYSSSLYSAIWVWLLTIVVTFVVTLLSFAALYVGGVGGQFVALAVIFILLSWVTVFRIPMLYRVPPFREAIDSTHLGKFALTFIPYNSCCMLMKLRNMMSTFEDITDGIQYLFTYLFWSMVFTLVGLALFAVQIATPPWNSQRTIARRQLRDNMTEVADALRALDSTLQRLTQTLTLADDKAFSASKTELEVAAATLANSVSPLLHALGSQSALRVRLVESGREPYWLYPGPRINVMPEMARVQKVLLQASMHLVGAAKQMALIVKAMDVFVVQRSRALLANIDEVRHSVKIAILVCKEGAGVLALSPSLRRWTTYNEKLSAAAQRLSRLREHMEGVRARSSLGYGPLTRQPSKGAQLVQRAHGLLQQTGVFPPKDIQSCRENEAYDNEEDTAGPDVSRSVEQSLPSIRKPGLGRKVSFRASQPADPSVAPDHYQPAVAEVVHPSAWGKTAMKSRIKLLHSKAATQVKLPKGRMELDTSIGSPLGSEYNPFLNLPSLDVQSSFGRSMSCNVTSPQGSLFENASIFETKAMEIGTNRAGRRNEGEDDKLPLRLATIPVRSESMDAGDIRNQVLLEGLERRGKADEWMEERDSSDCIESMTSGASGNTENPIFGGKRMRINGTSAAAADADAEEHFAGGGSARAKPRRRAQHDYVRGLGKGSASTGDLSCLPSMEVVHLLGLLGQDASYSGRHELDQGKSNLRRTSFRRFFKMNDPGKGVRGRLARDALTEVAKPGMNKWMHQSSLAGSSLSSSERNWYTLEMYERHPKAVQDENALKQQVKLTMFVVSVIQIASKDTLDFCAAIEALLYADRTPSWCRFWLNIRMVFLSGTIMGIQLSRGLWDILYFWRWRFSGAEAWFNDVDTVHCLKFVIGITGLYAVGVFADKQITLWLVGSLDLKSAIMPVSSWLMLGFVSTMKWTFEGTVHTATSRLLGTVLGCGCIYGAMMTTNDYGMMLAWNFILCFAAFFIFANSADVHSTFHPEFGYIGQVFLWTCLFIYQTVWLSMESSPSTFAALKLNVTNSRLWGNVIGIVTAVALSHFPPYFSSETEVRYICQSLMGDCSRCVSLIGAAFVRSVCSSAPALAGCPNSNISHQQQLQSQVTGEVPLHYQGAVSAKNNHPDNLIARTKDTQAGDIKTVVDKTKAGLTSSLVSSTVPGEDLVVHFQDIQDTFITNSALKQPKRAQEPKWRRGCCGIGFLAMPETFRRTPVATMLSHHMIIQETMRVGRKRRSKLRKKLQRPVSALKSRHFVSHLRSRHQRSRQLASPAECLQKATEILHHSFEPKLFVCRRLFLEGTKCPHSPLWWVDVSLGRVLDLMDYLRMSIADSCQDFMDCLEANFSDPSTPGAPQATVANCNLLMQTASGRPLRQRFVKLVAIQKEAYMDIGNELVAGRVGCWSRMPAFSSCDCGRRQVSELYLASAKEYMRKRKAIELTQSAILSDVVKCSRELRKQTGHSAQERRMALSVLLLLLQKIEMRHAVTDDIHMYIAKCILSRALPGMDVEEVLMRRCGSGERTRHEARHHTHALLSSTYRRTHLFEMTGRRKAVLKGGASLRNSVHS